MNANDTGAMPTDIVKAAFARSNWRAKLKSAGLLAVCLFSLFLMVVAPFELWQVRAVDASRPLAARLIKVSHERAPFKPNLLYWRYDILLTETGERVATSDVRPGDLPMSVMGWSSDDDDAARYRDGQSLTVFRPTEGGKIFLERGSYAFMSFVFAACFLFWMQLIVRAIRARR
jgi:hypothetical protein